MKMCKGGRRLVQLLFAAVLVFTFGAAFYKYVYQDTKAVTPYAEVSTTYTRVKGLHIYHAKDIRIGFDDVTTADTDSYTRLDADASPFKLDDCYFSTLTVRLKGDTTADTDTVRIVILK